MIITRTPLRISLAGGGSDVPAFCREEPGQTVTVAIDKYVTVTVSPKFDGSIRAAYSVTENVAQIGDLKHDLIRETLRWFAPAGGVEIHSIADIPGGTGLGSSSAFTVGLVAALYAGMPDYHATPAGLALAACAVELDRCGHPIGRQDQYATALGGVQHLTFTGADVHAQALVCDADALSRHMLLLYTGSARLGDAGEHITAQQQKRDDVRMLAQLAGAAAQALGADDLPLLGRVMHEAWLVKRKFVGTMPILDAYRAARRAGAWGGKLCGAGGGGFLAFLAPPETHAAIVAATGLRAVPVRAGVSGCEVIYAS